jgi:hypothetical protein
MSADKIGAQHRARKAVLYVRLRIPVIMNGQSVPS